MMLRRWESVRLLEWGLTALAVALVLGTVVTSILWHGTVVALLFSAVGLIAVSRDRSEHSTNWGLGIWAVCGGLIGLNLFHVVLGIAARFPLLWGTALVFLLVALLADYRRGRLEAIIVSLLVAVMAGFLSFYGLVTLQLAFSSH